MFHTASSATRPSRIFFCPLTGQIMAQPVVIADGNTFEHELISKHFEECRATGKPLTNPITETILAHNLLTRNLALEADTAPMKLIGHTGSVKCLSLLPQGLLVSGSVDNTIRIWDPKTGSCSYVLNEQNKNNNIQNDEGPSSYWQGFRISEEGICAVDILSKSEMISTSADGTVKQWLVPKYAVESICTDQLVLSK